jgi:hypothetical protein
VADVHGKCCAPAVSLLTSVAKAARSGHTSAASLLSGDAGVPWGTVWTEAGGATARNDSLVLVDVADDAETAVDHTRDEPP